MKHSLKRIVLAISIGLTFTALADNAMAMEASQVVACKAAIDYTHEAYSSNAHNPAQKTYYFNQFNRANPNWNKHAFYEQTKQAFSSSPSQHRQWAKKCDLHFGSIGQSLFD